MNVRTLRGELQRLEREGRGECLLYVFPGPELHDASFRPGAGVVVRFDNDDYPVERIDESYTQPEDSRFILLEFGVPDRLVASMSASAGRTEAA